MRQKHHRLGECPLPPQCDMTRKNFLKGASTEAVLHKSGPWATRFLSRSTVDGVAPQDTGKWVITVEPRAHVKGIATRCSTELYPLLHQRRTVRRTVIANLAEEVALFEHG